MLKGEEFKSQPVIFYFFLFFHLPNPIPYRVPSVPPSNLIPSLATSDQPSHVHPSPAPPPFAWTTAIISCSVFFSPRVPSRAHSPHSSQRDDFRDQFCQSHSYLKLCFSIELNPIPYDPEGNTWSGFCPFFFFCSHFRLQPHLPSHQSSTFPSPFFPQGFTYAVPSLACRFPSRYVSCWLFMFHHWNFCSTVNFFWRGLSWYFILK